MLRRRPTEFQTAEQRAGSCFPLGAENKFSYERRSRRGLTVLSHGAANQRMTVTRISELVLWVSGHALAGGRPKGFLSFGVAGVPLSRRGDER